MNNLFIDKKDLDILKNILKELFSNSNISFLIDVTLYENLPQSFKEEIDKNKVKIHPENQL